MSEGLPNPSVDVDRLYKALDDATEQLPPLSAAERISFLAAREDTENRTFALRLVCWVYAGGVACLLAVALCEGWWGDRAKAMQYIMDDLKVLVLPVLTLVIGHYIGRTSR